MFARIRCSRPRWMWFRGLAVGSGPHGVDGRTPSLGGYSDGRSIAITDPYILYQNYIAQGMIEKDEQQLRVMKELQKLYYRVVDYTPPEEMAIQMSLLLRKIELQYAESDSSNYFKRIFQRDPQHQRNQLVSYLTDEESLREIASPHGLLINGEVGCGKSMLLDIFAASLPHKSKMRWHYNTFILWVFNQIHQIQNERFLLNGRNAHKYTLQNEFLLFEIAQKMIDKSTILIFDEFMLPDIASANIIKILFTYFFKLGGVLVATSNKLPEELYSNQFHKKSFDTFVGILHSRCLTTDMRSQLDYRAKFASTSSATPHLVVEHDASNSDIQWNNLIKTHALKVESNKPVKELADPEPVTIRVYGRDVRIPVTFNNGKICYLDFEYICQGLFSSSDYITLASTFEVVIVDNVPIMTTKMKNDARRFISLLDALYEAKCQLFLRCQVEVDYLFFPDALYANDAELLEKLGVAQLDEDEVNRLQVQNEEMFAKTTIEMNNPYRPNVSTYDQSFTSTFNEEQSKATDFKDIKAFTGEDEKFAYKRAVSRIKEMVGSEIWRQPGRWVPVDHTMRPWETTQDNKKSRITKQAPVTRSESNQAIGDKPETGENKTETENGNVTESAPKFTSGMHFWKSGLWSNRNGRRTRDSIAKSWIRTSSKDEE